MQNGAFGAYDTQPAHHNNEGIPDLGHRMVTSWASQIVVEAL